MKKNNKKSFLKGLPICLISCLMTMQIFQVKVFANDRIMFSEIIANSTVENFGETVHSFDITVSEDIDLKTIKAEDFIIENAIIDQGGTKGKIRVKEVSINGNTITIEVDDFLLFKSSELKIICTSNEELSFQYNDITKIISPVADKFEGKEYNGLNYKLFSPKETEALPLVVWMHGRGDNGLQLRSAKNATMFAEDQNQEKNPSYVLAPQSDDSVTEMKWTDKELENIIQVINGLIEEGKVDKNRVYIIGHSMGGQGTWNLLRKAPDLFAAAITMAPRIIENQAELDDLKTLKNLPVWLFHATSDPINKVEGSRDRYNKLVEVGNTKVKYTELSDEEMKSFGIGYFSPFEFHATNVVMANTAGVVDWLFEQNKKIINEDTDYSEEKPSVDSEEKPTVDNNKEPSIDSEEKPTTDNNEELLIDNEEKPSVDNVEESLKDNQEILNNNEQDKSNSSQDNNKEVLPNTGAPIGTGIFILVGIIAIVAGKKLLKTSKA